MKLTNIFDRCDVNLIKELINYEKRELIVMLASLMKTLEEDKDLKFNIKLFLKEFEVTIKK